MMMMMMLLLLLVVVDGWVGGWVVGLSIREEERMEGHGG